MRMLCIDGGGIRGVLPIAVLRELEKETGCMIGEKFDLIAGTSTGSIIGASIALDKSMEDILGYYETYGEKIFKRQAKVGLMKSVYSDEDLRMLLKEAFGELVLSDVKKPLLIPAVDLTHGKPYIHRSHNIESEHDDRSIPLWDAVLSSCSAPVYFPPNNVNSRYLSVDGGLWANNPSLVCVTEAIHFFNKSLADIEILSLGTGKQKIQFTHHEKYWGLRHWMPLQLPSVKAKPKLLDLALNLSSESVSYHTQLLLGEKYLRINEELENEISFDEVSCMDELVQLGKNLFHRHRSDILNFLN
ncbi:CBASS cGAMP-activated phospholipase [Halobacillus campisalis]|uniref:CBASS cGAMP-activated phospholipase n=1 Tax=Halobacillus campisalis TaxID=435909 RepID=A0ABW2K8X3_9BACI|nr:CBASS cGAMP-activated phospholipase [Halobacillus campisalis]